MRLLGVQLGGVTVVGLIAFAVWLVSTGAPLQVSALLLLCAALITASASVAEDGTRALAPACVRVGRPAGSASQRAAFSACTHQRQGDSVSPRHQSIIPLLRVGR